MVIARASRSGIGTDTDGSGGVMLEPRAVSSPPYPRRRHKARGRSDMTPSQALTAGVTAPHERVRAPGAPDAGYEGLEPRGALPRDGQHPMHIFISATLDPQD